MNAYTQHTLSEYCRVVARVRVRVGTCIRVKTEVPGTVRARSQPIMRYVRPRVRARVRARVSPMRYVRLILAHSPWCPSPQPLVPHRAMIHHEAVVAIASGLGVIMGIHLAVRGRVKVRVGDKFGPIRRIILGVAP